MQLSFSPLSAGALAALAFASVVDAHSWPEALNHIASNGTIIPPPGFTRNFIPRTAPGFKGDDTDSFRKAVGPTAGSQPVCMDRQQQQIQSPGFPRLQASPGDIIAMRYIENGHVSLPQAGRSPKAGDVSIFGTTDGTNQFTFDQVSAWTTDGSGGSKQGKLLAKQPYDDGRCYQLNGGQISQQRQKEFPLDGVEPLKGSTDMPCQNNLAIPLDAPLNKPYTMFWTWNYTWVNETPGQIELYGVCMDIDIVPKNGGGGSGGNGKSIKAVANEETAQKDSYNDKQPFAFAAIPEYFSSLVSAGKDSGPAAPTPAPAPPGTTPAPAAPKPTTNDKPTQVAPSDSAAIRPTTEAAPGGGSSGSGSDSSGGNGGSGGDPPEAVIVVPVSTIVLYSTLSTVPVGGALPTSLIPLADLQPTTTSNAPKNMPTGSPCGSHQKRSKIFAA